MTSIFQNAQYPSDTSYQRRVAAWVHFTPQNFSTVPETRVKASMVGAPKGSFILPLQKYYSTPGMINYQDTEPNGMEMLGQGVRDMFAGGGLGKLSTMFMNIPIPKIGGLSLNDITNVLGGIKGAALQDVSYSDLMFKSTIKRPHTFTFDLLAKNSKDAEIMDYMVNGFQTRCYPFLESRNLNKVSPPPMWTIKIIPAQGVNKSKVLDNHIQTSVLVSCDIQRSFGTEITLTKDNNFLTLTVTLSFLEIEPTYRSYKDVENLYSRSAAGYGDII